MSRPEFDEMCGQLVKDSVARAEIEEIKKKALTFKVVAELPTEDIQENTIYLQPTGKTGSNKYTAHLYVNGEWEDFETVVEFDASQYAKTAVASGGHNYDFVVVTFNGLGAQVNKDLAGTVALMDTQGTIPMYWATTVATMPKNVLVTGVPIHDGHAANKKYVDDRTVGRNLLLNSNPNVTTSSYDIIRIDLAEKPAASETYTFTMKATLGEDRDKFVIYNSGGIVLLSDLARVPNTDIFTATFTWKNKEGNGAVVDDNQIFVYQFPSSGTSASTIEWAKLEKSSTFTYIADPELPYEAANKKYVDEQVASATAMVKHQIKFTATYVVEGTGTYSYTGYCTFHSDNAMAVTGHDIVERCIGEQLSISAEFRGSDSISVGYASIIGRLDERSNVIQNFEGKDYATFYITPAVISFSGTGFIEEEAFTLETYLLDVTVTDTIK